MSTKKKGPGRSDLPGPSDGVSKMHFPRRVTLTAMFTAFWQAAGGAEVTSRYRTSGSPSYPAPVHYFEFLPLPWLGPGAPLWLPPAFSALFLNSDLPGAS